MLTNSGVLASSGNTASDLAGQGLQAEGIGGGWLGHEGQASDRETQAVGRGARQSLPRPQKEAEAHEAFAEVLGRDPSTLSTMQTLCSVLLCKARLSAVLFFQPGSYRQIDKHAKAEGVRGSRPATSVQQVQNDVV